MTKASFDFKEINFYLLIRLPIDVNDKNEKKKKTMIFYAVLVSPRCLIMFSSFLIFSTFSSQSTVSAAFAASNTDDKFRPAESWNSGSGPSPAVSVSVSAAGSSGSSSSDSDDKCFDEKLKKPIACVPDFVNAAYGLPVQASSTCGDPARQFCSLTKDRLTYFVLFSPSLSCLVLSCPKLSNFV